MSIRKVAELKLCPRCEHARHIKPNFRLCDPCELEFLKVLQDNGLPLNYEVRGAA